jgi:FkbH-like protein
MLSFKELKNNLKRDLSSLPGIRIALLGDTATQFLGTAVQGTVIERGFAPQFLEAEYNQVERQFLDPDSELYRFDAACIVVFQSTHKLLSKYSLLPQEKQITLADERIDFVREMLDPARNHNLKNKNTRVIYCNYPEIDDAVFGSFSNKVENSFAWQVRKLNYELMRLSRQCPGLFICDIAAVQNKIGREAMFDASIYTSAEMVLSLDCVPLVASRIADIILAAQGQIKKCLILDLDNTLWGGIIGDDGLGNIQIGHGLGIGKAFTEFQQWIKKLKERGIILAVCSKNNEDAAKEPFEKHPDMVLRLEDIAVFVANWNNKADNIRHIQRVLNIGFDSMVFLDDNPVERAIVRENLPAVTVPELPEDPADYLEYLYGLNLFETISFSTEDAARTMQYQTEVRRVSSAQSFADEADFLKSLEMVCDVREFNAFNTPRAAQLTQRSNQFNLRTVRYTDADIERLSRDDRYRNFTFTLSDKFGDNGLVSVVILEKKDAKTLFIDTWLMSCRVLKRGMENFTMNTLAAYARENGFGKIIGEYIPTPKNSMVENHYPGLGFTPLEDGKRKFFVLDTDTDGYKDRECFIALKAKQ